MINKQNIKHGFTSKDDSEVIGNLTITETINSNKLITYSITSIQQNILVDTDTIILDFNIADNFYLTMTTGTTIIFSNVDINIGKSGNILIKEDIVGGHLFILDTEMKTPISGASIVQVTSANSLSLITYYIAASDTIIINYIGDFK